jgi:hypothetical protein
VDGEAFGSAARPQLHGVLSLVCDRDKMLDPKSLEPPGEDGWRRILVAALVQGFDFLPLGKDVVGGSARNARFVRVHGQMLIG